MDVNGNGKSLMHHRSSSADHYHPKDSLRSEKTALLAEKSSNLSQLHNLHSSSHAVTDLFHPSRKVGAWGLALLTFFNVSGGPWGSEPIVSSAGPLPGFVCLVLMALFWGLPISLVTSEMSSALPNNGGYVLWVDTAFGGFWGFQESFWSWGSCVVDNALYPVLAYETFIAMWEGDVQKPLDPDQLEAAHGWWLAYISKLILTVLFSLPVLIGRTEWVTKGMGIMVFLLAVPFAIMLPYIAFTRPMDWSQLLRSRPNLFSDPNIDWVALLHVTFWNFNGFDCASTCAGEVRDPGRSYPKGLLWALLVIVLMTGVPLMIATAANTPEWENWDVGWWSAIANQNAGPGFAWSVVFSSLVGTFGMHAAVMWEDAWQLCGMAEQGLAPRWLAGRNEKLGTPQNATLVSMGVVMALIMFDFRSMVIVDNFFSVASGLLEIAAFAHLKRTRPDLVRPYSIPGISGDFTLAVFLFMPLTLGIFIIVTSFNDGWVSIFTLIPFIIVGFLLPSAFKHSRSVHLEQTTKKSQRGISLDQTKSETISVTSPPTTSVGGMYGALHAAGMVAPSPIRPMGLSRDFSKESFGLGERPASGPPEGEEAELPIEEEEVVTDHIFVDDTVQFGSIFTDPKMFRGEDDEYLSAVGRDYIEEEDEEGDEEELDASAERRRRKKKYTRNMSQDELEENFYTGGTDEERSYDDASLD